MSQTARRRAVIPHTRAVHVREAKLTDASALAALIEQLGYPCSEQQMELRLLALFHQPEQIVRVAEVGRPDGGRAVAGVGALEVGHLLHREEPHAHLTTLVTDREHRHRGIARALVSELERVALSRGCGLLHLLTHRRRDDAHAFYRALGFDESHLAFDKTLS